MKERNTDALDIFSGVLGTCMASQSGKIPPNTHDTHDYTLMLAS